LKYERKISEAVIKRLPRYYRFLEDLMNMGISRVSSKDLSVRTGLNPSQIRQDFYCFGGFGLQGYGYDVEFLFNEIKKILGLDAINNIVIIGAGNIGQALAKYFPQQKKGFKAVGIFDVKPSILGAKIGELEIQHVDKMGDCIRENNVKIAAITVPSLYAREAVDMAIKQGIKGIWNFAPTELKEVPDVVIENIHLIDSLMVLGYKVNNN